MFKKKRKYGFQVIVTDQKREREGEETEKESKREREYERKRTNIRGIRRERVEKKFVEREIIKLAHKKRKSENRREEEKEERD